MKEEKTEQKNKTQKNMYLTSPKTGIPRQRTQFSTQPTYFQPRQPTTEPKIYRYWYISKKNAKAVTKKI